MPLLASYLLNSPWLSRRYVKWPLWGGRTWQNNVQSSNSGRACSSTTLVLRVCIVSFLCIIYHCATLVQCMVRILLASRSGAFYMHAAMTQRDETKNDFGNSAWAFFEWCLFFIYLRFTQSILCIAPASLSIHTLAMYEWCGYRGLQLPAVDIVSMHTYYEYYSNKTL